MISPITDHTIRAVVIKDGQVALAAGDRSTVFDVIPAGLLTDAGSLLNWAGRYLPDGPAGVLIVPSLPGYGADDWSIHQRAEVMTLRASAAGWTRQDGRWAETGWIVWTNQQTGQTISMGALDLMAQDRTPVANLTGTAVQIAYEFAQYDQATGTPWLMTAGVTGCTMLRGMVRGGASARLPATGSKAATGAVPTWRSRAPQTPAPTPAGIVQWPRAAGDIRWSRDLAPAEAHGYVHHLDVNAMYLAAAAAVNLPWGELRPRDPHTFDPSAAGYWLVNARDLPVAETGPSLWNPAATNEDGTVYLTTPVMELLSEYGHNPAVLGALLPPTQSRLMRKWAETLRDRLAQDGWRDTTRAALKRTYTETIGMFNAPGGSIYRPEWRDLIIDTARANLSRKLHRARVHLGILPVRIHVDSVWYAHPDADPFEVSAAVGGSLYGRQIGRFRHVKTVPASEYTIPSQRKADA